MSQSETIVPSASETQLAKDSFRALSRFLSTKPSLSLRLYVHPDGEPAEAISVPESLFRVLKGILEQMANSNALTLIPTHAELTTQEAADLIDVSTSFLVEQLDNGNIPYHKVGTHRRVRFADLMNYKDAIDQRRLKDLEQLAAEAQELNMGY